MSVQARFKDCDEYPCPRGRDNEKVLRCWDKIRGRAVVLHETLPQHRSPCGSDTFWRVHDPMLTEIVSDVYGENWTQFGPEWSVCRHLLEIGD